MFPHLPKTTLLAFFSDSFKTRFVKFCMVIAFKVTGCQKHNLQIVCFWSLASVAWALYGCYIDWKDYAQYAQWVSDVYLMKMLDTNSKNSGFCTWMWASEHNGSSRFLFFLATSSPEWVTEVPEVICSMVLWSLISFTIHFQLLSSVCVDDGEWRLHCVFFPLLFSSSFWIYCVLCLKFWNLNCFA